MAVGDGVDLKTAMLERQLALHGLLKDEGFYAAEERRKQMNWEKVKKVLLNPYFLGALAGGITFFILLIIKPPFVMTRSEKFGVPDTYNWAVLLLLPVTIGIIPMLVPLFQKHLPRISWGKGKTAVAAKTGIGEGDGGVGAELLEEEPEKEILKGKERDVAPSRVSGLSSSQGKGSNPSDPRDPLAPSSSFGPPRSFGSRS